MGFELEVEMVRQARAMDLLTAPYVFTEDEARAMADAGADVLVPHMGLTTGGAIGARSGMSLDEAVERVQALHDAAKAVNPDVLCLCHGGPIAEPDDAGTSWSARRAWSASSAPRASSACRRRWR